MKAILPLYKTYHSVMNKTLLILFTWASLLVSSCSNGQQNQIKTNLNANEFAQKIKDLPQAPLLDVRTPGEYSKGHLLNSINIDWNGDNFNSETSKLDKSKPILVYCLSGGRSAEAAEYLRKQGFKEVYELQGGIMKWRAANLPETTEKTISTKTSGMTMSQFKSITTSDKIILVDFYADWCAPCKKMKPYLDEINSTMGDRVTVVRINADENKDLLSELKVDALPTLQLFKAGKQVWNQVGYISKEDLIKVLK